MLTSSSVGTISDLVDNEADLALDKKDGVWPRASAASRIERAGRFGFVGLDKTRVLRFLVTPMTAHATVKATTFARHFARYQDEAIREKVIVVTSHDRVVGGYLSAEELAHYQRLKARERQVLKVGELPDDLIAAIEAAEYGVGPA